MARHLYSVNRAAFFLASNNGFGVGGRIAAARTLSTSFQLNAKRMEEFVKYLLD